MKFKKLNLCLLNPDIYTPNMPARPAVTEIYGNYLPSFGHKVVWLSLSDKDLKTIKKEKYNEVIVYLIPYPRVSNIVGKISCFVKHYIYKYMLLHKILKEESYDIIQVRNDVFSALIILYIKRKYKIPFVFQYSFPKDFFKHNKKIEYHSYIFNQFQVHIQKYILKNADYIFPISKWMEIELLKEGIPKSKMMPLPMGVNPELFSLKKSGLKIREKYNLQGLQVILYLGNMDSLRSLDIILKAFSKIVEYAKYTMLLMVGDGNDKNHLEEISFELGIDKNVIFTGKVSYFEIPFYISASDICLSPIRPLDSYKVSSPTKLFEYMVMCKPVVANNEIPEQNEIIKESQCGVLVEFNPESFAKGILTLLSNPYLAKQMGKNGYKWVVDNRSYETMAHSVEKQYFELLEKKGKL